MEPSKRDGKFLFNRKITFLIEIPFTCIHKIKLKKDLVYTVRWKINKKIIVIKITVNN